MKGSERKAALAAAARIAATNGGKASEPAMAAKLVEAGMSETLSEKMAREARLLAASGRVAEPETAPQEEARLTARDLDALARTRSELTGRGPALLCAMLLCLRARPHRTGRIRYGDGELRECAGYPTTGEYRRDFASLHAAGLVRCAVVGSKEPVQTLSLPWAPEGPKEGEEAESVPFAKGEGKRLADRLAKEGTE